MNESKSDPQPTMDRVLVEVLENDVTYRLPDGQVMEGHLNVAGSPEAVIDGLERGLVAGLSDKLYKRARVLAVGPGKPHPKTGALAPMFVKPGDLVVYAEAPTREETPVQSWKGQRWMTQGGLKWHSGESVWPGPGDRAIIAAGCIVVALEPEDRIEFPITLGGETLPAVTGPNFDSKAAGGRLNQDRTEDVADVIGERW
jgi:hypothetical protein